MPQPDFEDHEVNNCYQRLTELFYRLINEQNPVPGLIIPEDHDIYLEFFWFDTTWDGWSRERKDENKKHLEWIEQQRKEQEEYQVLAWEHNLKYGEGYNGQWGLPTVEQTTWTDWGNYIGGNPWTLTEEEATEEENNLVDWLNSLGDS